MSQSLILVGLVVAGWSLLSARFDRWHIGAPFVVVLAGIAIGLSTTTTISEALNTEVALQAAELILAVLLFVDATEVRGGLSGDSPRHAFRLLFIALPVSLALAVGLGLVLMPNLGWAALLVLACVVVPSDFAPATFIVRDAQLPQRIRRLLNVESGYNDGIVSPIFLFALILASDRTKSRTLLDALATAATTAIKAILIGIIVGAALAVLMNVAERRGLMNDQAKRLILVATPIVAFALAVIIDGNGFVAAFVCGIAVNYVRSTPTFRQDLQLLDDITFLVTVGMWFVFGIVAVFAFTTGIDWQTVAYCLAALTLIRILPVVLSLLRTSYSWRERLLMGALGPRGTTSIVFGLLAFNTLDGDVADITLTTMVFCVLGSVLLHGTGSTKIARALTRPRR